MFKDVLVVTALLTFPFGTAAVADDNTEQQHTKRAQKIIATLKMLGIANPSVNSLVDDVESHVEKDGYLYLADRQTNDGRLSLRFATNSKTSPQELSRLQLSYAPKDSHYVVNASTKGIMLNYHYEFK